MSGRPTAGRPGPSIAPRSIAALVLALLLVGCGAGAGAPPRPSGSGPSAIVAASAPLRTPPATTAASQEASLPTAGSDSTNILRLCWPGPPEPTDLDCRDAVDAAMAAAQPRSQPVRAELSWSRLCPAGTPCPSAAQDPDAAYVVLDLDDGTGIEVPVRLENGGIVTGSPSTLSARDLGPRPTFASPPASKAEIGQAPAIVANRAALPLCGAEDAGLAGPFDAKARSCFLSSLLAGEPAELASRRSDVGGAPFLELWRFEGSGPVVVFREDAGHWSKLACGITPFGTDQAFDHTDCDVTPVS